MTEIACPGDCAYLASAQAHPAAVARRQQEHDLAFMTGLMKGLSSGQKQFTWAVLAFVSGFSADPMLRLSDEDVADMAAALSSTFETATRGVIYEHRPRSLNAQRLATDVRAYLDETRGQAGAAFDRDAAAVFAGVGRAFGAASTAPGATGSEALAAVKRLLAAAESAARAESAQAARIEPPGPALVRP
jgi:hypothetical protein